MRVEIAACLLAFSLAMLVPKSAPLPPAAVAAVRAAPAARSTAVRELPVAREAQSRALPALLREGTPRGNALTTSGGSAPTDRAAQPGAGARQGESELMRLQNVW